MSESFLKQNSSPEPERSGVVGSPEPVCVVCGGPREPRKREACSDRCRAALSRQRRQTAAWEVRVRVLFLRSVVDELLEKVEASLGAGGTRGP